MMRLEKEWVGKKGGAIKWRGTGRMEAGTCSRWMVLEMDRRRGRTAGAAGSCLQAEMACRRDTGEACGRWGGIGHSLQTAQRRYVYCWTDLPAPSSSDGVFTQRRHHRLTAGHQQNDCRWSVTGPAGSDWLPLGPDDALRRSCWETDRLAWQQVFRGWGAGLYGCIAARGTVSGLVTARAEAKGGTYPWAMADTRT